MATRATLQRVAIIGAGGFGREVLDIAEACNNERPSYDVLGFIVDHEYGTPGTTVNDKPILGGFDWLEAQAGQVFVVCGVGTPEHRRRLVQRARAAGARFCSIIHPSAVITRWVSIGEGVVVAAGCILTNQIHIGDHVHLNLDCTIGHDAVLEEYATLAPGVHISGGVMAAEGCYVGTGANVIERIHLGEWSTVGAGSTVIRDVPANSTVIGVPARVIRVRESGWHL